MLNEKVLKELVKGLFNELPKEGKDILKELLYEDGYPVPDNALEDSEEVTEDIDALEDNDILQSLAGLDNDKIGMIDTLLNVFGVDFGTGLINAFNKPTKRAEPPKTPRELLAGELHKFPGIRVNPNVHINKENPFVLWFAVDTNYLREFNKLLWAGRARYFSWDHWILEVDHADPNYYEEEILYYKLELKKDLNADENLIIIQLVDGIKNFRKDKGI